MAHLKYLLGSKEGRQYVACCLVEALDKHKEIRPGLPREPYPSMTLDDVGRLQSEELAQRAYLVLHVNKSHETDTGWVVIESFPAKFIRSLPPTIEVDEKCLAHKLGELKHMREHIRRLQERGTQLKNELEALKNSCKTPMPDFVTWWRNFSEETRQNIYFLLDDEGDTSLNSAKSSAGAILRWMAKEGMTTRWDLAADRWQQKKDEDRGKIVWLEAELRLAREEEEAAKKQRDEGSKLASEETRKLNEARKRIDELNGDITQLHNLLGQAVVAMNQVSPPAPESEWMKRYKAQHEKYSHQTPTGRAVDRDEEFERLRGKNIELSNQLIKLQQRVVELNDLLSRSRSEESATLEMHDNFMHRILDVMEPEFYDPNTPTARSGVDYEAIIKGIERMKALSLDKELNQDFGEFISSLIADGRSNEEILNQIGEGDHEDLVGLIRNLMKE